MIGKRSLYLRVIFLAVFTLSLFFVPLNGTDYCGDANKDGSINILDVVEIISYKYKDGPPPWPLAICDADHSGSINILDIVYIINYKYKGGPAPDCLLFECASIKGDCLSRESGITRLDPNGFMTLEIDGNDLHVFHNDAFYNCCLEYNTSYSIMGNGINIFEFDAGQLCDCNCYFNLESVIEDIPIGQYFVTLFSIPGDTVGFQSIEIVLSVGELTDYSTSGCVAKTRGDISYSLSDGILTMQDINSTWNCAAADHPIIVEYEQIRDTLRFHEISLYSGNPVICQCPVDITATVSNILPAQYVAEIYRTRFAGFEPELVDRREILLE